MTNAIPKTKSGLAYDINRFDGSLPYMLLCQLSKAELQEKYLALVESGKIK